MIWKSETRKLSELKAAKYNPRKLSAKQKADLNESIEKFSLVDPLVINIDGTIIGGHQRFGLLHDRGVLEVDVRVPERKLDQVEEKELNLRLNKNTGEFDLTLLSNFDADMLVNVGFDGADLDKIFKTHSAKDDQLFDERSLVDIKVGDIFEMDEHILVCGDSTTVDFKNILKDRKAKMIFTSPPYNMNAGMYKNYDDNLGSQQFIDLNLNVIKNVLPALEGFLFWNMSYNANARWEFIEVMYRIIKETPLKFLEMIVWNKKNAMPITAGTSLTRVYEDVLVMGTQAAIAADLDFAFLGANDKKSFYNKKTQMQLTNLWEISSNNASNDQHKACFPVELPVTAMLLMTARGDVVIDPFGGMGSTLIAAEKVKRIAVLIELSPVYCDMTIQRWQNYTGKKARRI